MQWPRHPYSTTSSSGSFSNSSFIFSTSGVRLFTQNSMIGRISSTPSVAHPKGVRIFANQSADGKAPPHGETQVPRRRKSAPHPHFLPRPFPSNTEGPSEKNRSKSLKDLPLPSLGGNHPGLTGKPDYSGGPGRDSSLSAPICSSFFLIALRLGFPSPTTSPSITTTGYQSSSSITRRENSASRSPSGPWMST